MAKYLLSRMTLLARFTIVSFSITVMVAIGLAWELESQLERNALWRQAESTAQQVKSVLNPNLRAADLDAPLDENRYEQIDRLVHSTLFSTDVVRIKIWSLQGMLIYSDDRQIVGRQFPISDELQKAFGGQMATDISSLDKPENVSERGQFNRLFEIYVPLQPANSPQVLGAYEVYFDLAALQPQLTNIRNYVWGGVGLGFLILYAALFFLVRNASRELVQRSEENRRLLSAEREQHQLSETLGRVGLALSEVLDLHKLLDLICRESTSVFNASSAFLWLIERDELVGFAAHGPGSDRFIGMHFPLSDPQLLGARVAREKHSVIINDTAHSDEVRQELIQLFEIQSMLGVPLIKGERVLGSLMILDTENPRRFNQKDLETASVFGSYAAVAIDNASSYEEAQRHVQHEQSLREIDRAISSSLNLEFTLQVVLKQALGQLGADASDILLLDPVDQTLFYSAGLGFQGEQIRKFRIRLGEGVAGRVALQRQTVFVPAIAESETIPERAGLLVSEGFVSFAAAPLVAKGKNLGVLEVFQRAALNPAGEWLEFLETLAGQAAIAIDNASLFFDLQRSNIELAQAYDATIEGWAHALELRDKETEGHTRRVTDMTLQLAKAMGSDDQELVQIRRGALLHDIGKMAIPDSILLKPLALTDEEWKIMRNHPQLAYNMLFRISYLAKSLDIPYFHHEKWDGSGYPRGLAGEQIPLSARLFAVVDVYDALISDRPYRKAWTQEAALAYIREQTGKHFDPRIAELFLKMYS